MNNSCVIGYGMVGQATAKLFGIDKHFDIITEKSNMTLIEASKCRVIFICIPTPEIDGKYLVGDIVNMVTQIKDLGGNSVFVIRSTVFPGFADYLKSEVGVDVISNPEFLTESTWEKDTQYPPFVILGGEPGSSLDIVKGMYDSRIKSAKVIVTDNKTAEMAKLALNGFFVAKVVYANEIYDMCQSLGMNYGIVKEVFEKHPFGYKNHAEVYHKGGRGAGGKCLKKDMRVLANLSSSKLLATINETNQYLLEEYPKNGNKTA
jgi:UDPglucose 6-dehydrogenase